MVKGNMKFKVSSQVLVPIFVFAITYSLWMQLFLPAYLDSFDTDLTRYLIAIESLINRQMIVTNPAELLFYSGVELLISSQAGFFSSDDLARLIIMQVVALSIILLLFVITVIAGSSFKSWLSVSILFFTLMNPLVIEFYLLNLRSSIAFSMMIGALFSEGWRRLRILIGVAAAVMHFGVALIPLIMAAGYFLRRVLIGFKLPGSRYLHALGCVAFALAASVLLNTASVSFGLELAKSSVSLTYIGVLASFFFYGLFLARRLHHHSRGFIVLFLICLFIFGWSFGLNFNRYLQMGVILMSIHFMLEEPISVKKFYLGALVGFDSVLLALRFSNMA